MVELLITLVMREVGMATSRKIYWKVKFYDGAPYEVKVSCTVRDGGKLRAYKIGRKLPIIIIMSFRAVVLELLKFKQKSWVLFSYKMLQDLI